MSSAGSSDNHSNASTSPTGTDPGLATLLAVGACFVLSGFAALLYQTAWMRQFSLVFGTSEIAVATVLAAYMGGLALGARMVERYLDRVQRPVLVYGALEFGIALGALAVPALLVFSEGVMVATIGDQPAPPSSEGWAQTTFYLATAFVVLLAPTTLMGATLPLLTRHAVRSEAHIARRTGMLYAVNTLGAVGGALVAAFLLLPWLGLRGTVFVGAAINVLVFVIAALISTGGPSPRSSFARVFGPGASSAAQTRSAPTSVAAPAIAAAPGAPDPATSSTPVGTDLRVRVWQPGPHWILPVMLASGAVSFVYEVLWTRMLSFVLGGSIYAFATMVASFLLGIAAGSAVASQVVHTRRGAQLAFIVVQLAIALCSIAIYLAIDAMVPETAGLRGNVALAIGVLLPATLFIGATFPLAVRTFTSEPRAAAGAAARVYAWNTVGAIVGALLAGFILIPELRFEGSIRVAVFANSLLALIAAMAVARTPLVWSAAAAIACLAVGFGFRAPIPDRLIRSSPLNVSSAGNLHYYEVGRSASVVVLEQDGSLLLRTNGLPEAIIGVAGAPPNYSGEFWLSPLAVIARPAAESMLVVGYGGGVVIDGIPPTVRSIDVIELEPKVMEANRAIRSLRARDPLLDRRVNLIVNDARGALALTGKRYDAIVSQPSHPWTAGASHLYTREFMRQAANHLTDGGVFVQWMNISFLDEELLRSLSATLLDVFGQLRIYRPDPNTLVFLASTRPLDIEQQLVRTGAPLVLAPRHYARFGIHVVEDVLVALVADQEGAVGLARGAELLTDDRNRMATAGAYDRGIGLTPQSASSILAPYDPLQRRGSWVFRDLSDRASFGYAARRISSFRAVDQGSAARIQGLARAVADPSTAAYVRAVGLSISGDGNGAQRLLTEALGIDPGNDDARYELLRPWLTALTRGDAPGPVSEAASYLPPRAGAVITARRHATKGDWGQLPTLDATLQSSRWTDVWYVESALLRADWRSRVSNPNVRGRFGREALAIVDEVAVTQPSSQLFTLRARAATAADRPDVVVESIAEVVRTLSAGALRSETAPDLRRNVESLRELMAAVADDERVRPERRTQVRAALEQLRSKLAAGVP